MSTDWWLWVVSIFAAVAYAGWATTLLALGMVLRGRRVR